jgi:signal transduction histidine kinase
VSYLLARRALSPVQKSYKEQQRFVDDASHELRTPLSVLQGELELALRRSRSSGEYKAAISTSLDEIQSLNELITSLLLMARGSQTNIKRSFEVIELSSLIRDLVATCGQLYTSKHLTYQIKASEVYIDGYPELIKRCIGNVLDNACKFTNKNGNIDVEIREIGSEVSIRVHDNGIGMAPEEVKHAYDRFWRAEEARSIRGHGLGLSLVQQIVELHGGKVKIASKKDAGTTVTLLFPK